MRRGLRAILWIVVVGVLGGCGGQSTPLTMQAPAGQPPQHIVFPNGTVFGGASGREATTLAQIAVDSNNNNMREYQALQGTETRNLKTSQQALQMLEQLSNQQGTGQITLFFGSGEHTIPQNSLQYTRLVTFLDYLSRESRGRQVLFVLIGSASTTGNVQINERLSRERAAAPEPIIDQYLVNVPHRFYKVYGLGDVHSPKDATLTVDQRYQNVRVIAVYQTDQVPLLPTSAKSQ
jgi:outer membrane protein OmpA-like peptidoglycan-associated protein